MEMIQASGQQGVPVITVDGQVVVGFDQPRLMQLIGQARQAKPRLGASIADAASQVHKHPGIPGVGAFVGRVRPGTAAERAGLLPGAVIISLAGEPVQRAADVYRLVPRIPRGRDVPLTYVRDSQARETQVRL